MINRTLIIFFSVFVIVISGCTTMSIKRDDPLIGKIFSSIDQKEMGYQELMNELLQAFVLGNTVILTNVCVLPLYPGLIAFLAGTVNSKRSRRTTNLLGLFVLAGVLGLMIVVGWLLFAFQRSFGDILPFLLPIIYGLVIDPGCYQLKYEAAQ